MNNYPQHMEISFCCHNNADYQTDIWFKAFEEYETAFPYYNLNENQREYQQLMDALEKIWWSALFKCRCASIDI